MKSIILSFLLCLATLVASAANLQPEELHYVISYKWGLIHKDAGTATLSLRPEGGDGYRLMLTARTKPWADKVFQVRDTLVSTVSRADLRPHRYVKSAHEGGRYSRDLIDFTYAGSRATGAVERTRVDKKGKRSVSSRSLTATGATFDMLSVFYYLRTLDYEALSHGGTVTANIFSGSKTERLSIRCVGRERIKPRDSKTEIDTWHIRFRFTTDGRRKSSDDIDAWISADSRHIPVRLYGSLPLGQVRVYLLAP